jgi:hypothetical protein
MTVKITCNSCLFANNNLQDSGPKQCLSGPEGTTQIIMDIYIGYTVNKVVWWFMAVSALASLNI